MDLEGNGMKKRYIKMYQLNEKEYIGLLSFNYGKEKFCYTEVIKNDNIVSKARNKIYISSKGKYIVKGRKRYYLEKFE